MSEFSKGVMNVLGDECRGDEFRTIDQNTQTNHRVLHNAGANIPQQNTANSLNSPQIDPVPTMQNWPEQFCKPNNTIANTCKAGQNHVCKPVIFILHPISHFAAHFIYQPCNQCKIGHTQSANQSFQFLIWPEQVCKPGIKIGQTQSANQ